MWEEVFNIALNNGIWAVLFCALLIYQLRDSKMREEKYQKTIQSLSTSLQVVQKMHTTVCDTHGKVLKLSQDVTQLKRQTTKTQVVKKQIAA